MKYINDLEKRVERLERRASLLNFLSARKRQLKSEEKQLKKRFESLSGIDFSIVSIDSKTEDYKGLKLNDMEIKISYLGEVYDLVGRRVESLSRGKSATPYFFFDRSKRKQRSIPVSQLSSGARSYEKVEVHYKISFPKRLVLP